MEWLRQLVTRRPSKWEPPTLLDHFLTSPLNVLVHCVHLFFLWLRGIPVRPPTDNHAVSVVCISDTHDSIVPNIPDGDLLIHAGDTTSHGSAVSIQHQIDWLATLPHGHKVLVAGNHDNWFDPAVRNEEDVLTNQRVDFKGIHYLQHKSISLTFKNGRRLNLYGAPGIPYSGSSNNAFQYLAREDPWKDTIPKDTDILITHTPPLHHMDLSLGCPSLLAELWRSKPLLHVFGHVHWGRGIQATYWDDCQLAYESFMSRKTYGPTFDMIPTLAWIQALRLLLLNARALVWQWFMLGGVRPSGGVMINAAVQDGNTGNLVKADPFSISI